jgi:HAE1 family hydrophobic/amphiphilic exporter-1
MAVTIIGGQMLCLLLTLLVTPVVYSCFEDLREANLFALLRRLRRGPHAPGSAVAPGQS